MTRSAGLSLQLLHIAELSALIKSKMKELLSKYKNLVFAAELFDISWMESVGLDGNRESLERLLKEGIITRSELVIEFNKAYESKTFDWKFLAKELNLIYESESMLYDAQKIKELVGFYLFPYLYSGFEKREL